MQIIPRAAYSYKYEFLNDYVFYREVLLRFFFVAKLFSRRDLINAYMYYITLLHIL